MKKCYDIFCNIVDNFGDIGVCWRLARQLQAEHALDVRLWIDDLHVAQTLIPSLQLDKPLQVVESIKIMHWTNTADFSNAAEVVIETFACGLPIGYLAAMAQQHAKWVNLEYLSAEPWVADFHARPSPQAQGLTRYFYFPGFAEGTGGLLREQEIDKYNQSFTDENQQDDIWQRLNIVTTVSPSAAPSKHVLKVSLFCYPHAPITALLHAMAQSQQVTHCYVPATSILPNIADYFGVDALQVGDVLQQGNLQLHVLPFLSQQHYDELLNACDINFVRGEDSWVRAIWAGKPFIWQPYWQEENTHLQKLDAFIDVFYQQTTPDVLAVVRDLHHTWVQQHESNLNWPHYLAQLSAVKSCTQHAATQLAAQTDLAAKLVIFCNKI